MVFYAFDEEEYIRDRDFYFGYRDFVPGDVVDNQADLSRTALEVLSGEKVYDTSAFEEDFLEAVDGKSSRRIAEYIKKNYLKGHLPD